MLPHHSSRIWWLALSLVVVAVVVAVGYYTVFKPRSEPPRRNFGVAHLSSKEIQKIGYTATYQLMMALKEPWRFGREPASVPAPRRPSVFIEPGRWKQIAGPYLKNGWPDVRSFDIKAMASFKGSLYVGIRAGWSYNRDDIALVFGYDGKRWAHVGGDGVRNSWKAGSQNRIQDLHVVGDRLYAAIGGTLTGEGEVWRYDGRTWELFAGRGKGWAAGEHDVAYALATYNGGTYVAVHSLDLKVPPAIYRFKNNRWDKVAGSGELGSWQPKDEAGQPRYFQAYELLVFRGELYVAMTSSAPRLDIWRFNEKRWERVAGNGLRDSWTIKSRHRKHYLVTDLRKYRGFLIATLAFWGEEQFHPIWAFDGERWAPVGNVLPAQWRFNRNSNSAIVYRDRIYVGIQNPWIGPSLWEYGGRAWRPVLGYDKFGSWGPSKPPGGILAYPYLGYVYRMVVHKGRLVAALGSEVVGGAQVWQFEAAN